MTVFTTHTPVPAGHDRFNAELIEEHLGPAARRARHLARSAHGPGPGRAAEPARAVLHDRAGVQAVAAGQRRQRCTASSAGGCGPLSGRGAVEEEIPIGHITNGVHVPSWLAPQMHHAVRPRAAARLVSAHGRTRGLGSRSSNCRPGELWETHQTLKNRLLDFARNRLSTQARRRNECRTQSVADLARCSIPTR